MREKIPTISMGSKICDNCRKQLYKLPDSTKPLDSTDEYEVSDLDLSSINQCLEKIGETPIVSQKLHQQKYPKQKVKKISTAINKAVIRDKDLDSDDESEIIKQLKEEFHTTTQQSKKIQILTVLPKSWSIKQVQTEFGTSSYMARKAKNLVKESGILETPNPKLGSTLSPQSVLHIQQFYESDDISRLMPGRKDFVSAKQGKQRVHIQKRLVLSNLKEVYQLFKDTFPTEKVGFSKFAELRPKHCVLAGTSGTHAVCVCTIHQNVKLMMLGAKL